MLNYAISRALDPTLFGQDLGLVLDSWQAALLCEQPRRALLNCSRQTGKSTICAVLGLYKVTFQPDAQIMIVSPSARQSNEMIRSIRRLYENLNRKPKLIIDAVSKLEFDNRSRIWGLPGGDADGATIRGISGVHLLIIDEAARCADQLFAATRPMVATTGGSIIALSTPAGRRGAFYEYWHANDQTWTRIKVSAEECPRISAEFLAEELRELGPTRYAEEYGLKFIDNQESAFPTAIIDRAFTNELAPLW